MLRKVFLGLVDLRRRLSPLVTLWYSYLVNMQFNLITGLLLFRRRLLVVIRPMKFLKKTRKILRRLFSLTGSTRPFRLRFVVLTCLLRVRVRFLRLLKFTRYLLLLVLARLLDRLLSWVRIPVVCLAFVGRSWCRLLVVRRRPHLVLKRHRSTRVPLCLDPALQVFLLEGVTPPDPIALTFDAGPGQKPDHSRGALRLRLFRRAGRIKSRVRRRFNRCFTHRLL